MIFFSLSVLKEKKAHTFLIKTHRRENENASGIASELDSSLYGKREEVGHF